MGSDFAGRPRCFFANGVGTAAAGFGVVAVVGGRPRPAFSGLALPTGADLPTGVVAIFGGLPLPRLTAGSAFLGGILLRRRSEVRGLDHNPSFVAKFALAAGQLDADFEILRSGES